MEPTWNRPSILLRYRTVFLSLLFLQFFQFFPFSLNIKFTLFLSHVASGLSSYFTEKIETIKRELHYCSITYLHLCARLFQGVSIELFFLSKDGLFTLALDHISSLPAFSESNQLIVFSLYFLDIPFLG